MPGFSDASDPDRLRFYVEGLGASVLIPAIRGESLWLHPAVSAVADARLIAGLRNLADRAFALVDEMPALPQLPVHGEASPQNLLVEARPAGTGRTEFAVIDWGLCGLGCAGFDLGQLLSGWVNQGTMGGEGLIASNRGAWALTARVWPSPVPILRNPRCAAATRYRWPSSPGSRALPTKRLAEQDSEELRDLVAGRADMARFVLDLLASTD